MSKAHKATNQNYRDGYRVTFEHPFLPKKTLNKLGDILKEQIDDDIIKLPPVDPKKVTKAWAKHLWEITKRKDPCEELIREILK